MRSSTSIHRLMAHRLRRTASAMRPTRCCHHQGQGAQLGDPGRRRRSPTPAQGRSVRTRWRSSRPPASRVTDELQRISRQGWSDDEPMRTPRSEAFRPAQTSRAEASMALHPRDRRNPQRPRRHRTVARWTRRPCAPARPRRCPARGAGCRCTRSRTRPRRRHRATCRSGSTPRSRPTPTGCSCTSTAARSSSAAWTPTTTSRGPWPRRPGYKVISVGYRLAPEAAFPAGLDDCYGVVRWAAEQRSEPGLGRQEPRHRRRQLGRQLRRRRRREGPRRRVRPDHAPGPLLPVAGPGLRRRPLRLAAGERRGVRAGDGGPAAVQLLLPRERRGSGRPARLPHQARGPRRAAAGPDHHGRARPAARRGRALRPAAARRPAWTRRSAATPGPTTASSSTSPGSRSSTGRSRRPA